MSEFQIKPSPRLVRQIAKIERFSGSWEKISDNPVLASSDLEDLCLRENCAASLALDHSAPLNLSPSHDSRPKNDEDSNFISLAYEKALRKLRSSYDSAYELDMVGLSSMYAEIDGQGVEETELLAGPFRETPIYFLAPSSEDKKLQQIVFPTVAPFLIEPRLSELLCWAREELLMQNHHPLFIIGSFHLMLLQIHPFPTANHRIALRLMTSLLEEHEFEFVRYSSIPAVFERRKTYYFKALRQAEKTARSSWNTLNIWLEFFLESMIEASTLLADYSENRSKSLRLTTVQKKIIEVIQVHGAASRDRIVKESGINLSTVKYNLNVLATKGHLKREGGGRSTSYRVL